MLASDIITLGGAVFGFLTALVGSSACLYTSRRNGRINIAVLRVKLHSLEIVIDELQHRMDGIMVLKPDPSSWISEARGFLSQVNVSGLEGRADEICTHGWLPNLCPLIQVGREIEEKIGEADMLLVNGRHISQEASVIGYKQPEVDILGSSRRDIMNAILERGLQVSRVGTVCIHGIAGVGKTAVAQVIHNQGFKMPTHFDYVIWVTIKYGIGLWQVQEDIARSIGVDISALRDTAERAKVLSSALIRKSKFLLVLDSMRQAFSLHDIGIPEPTQCRSKLVITSRLRYVCKRITRKEFFEIKPLSEVEAWELFKNEVGYNLSQLQTETLTSTEALVRELDGLPLAIKTLALSFIEMHENSPTRIDASWNEELVVLSKPAPELYTFFKENYDNLRGETQVCFLCCALYPKGYAIKTSELIEYWLWDGLLGEIKSLDERRKRGRREILREIKDAHLLEDVHEEGKLESVKLLNLVWHMALDIMIKEGNCFFVKSGSSLTDVPRSEDWPPEPRRASFMKNQLRALSLQNKPNVRNLTTLLLQDNPLSFNSNDLFFYGMRNLRLLDLSRTEVSSLPRSLSYLTNLRALLLRSCPYLKQLPPLSKLQQLIVLDLSSTPLELWPEGMHSLTKLRRLDLSGARLEIIPAKVVARLSQLEELLLNTDDNGGYLWGSNRIDWGGACVEELVELRHLVNLQLNFLNAKVFTNYVNSCASMDSRVPPRFKFCVGGFYTGSEFGENSIIVIGNYNIKLPKRTLELHLMMSGQIMASLKLNGCLKDLTIVDVSNFHGLRYLFAQEILASMKNLRKICVRRCYEMVGIIQPAAEANPASITIAELTVLILFDLPKLESICHGQVLSCPYLRGLEVWSCQNLRLPMIFAGGNNRKIEIKGERSWLENLKWDNPNNINPLFHDSPASNSLFKIHGASVPSVLSSTPRVTLKTEILTRSNTTDVLEKTSTVAGSSIPRFLQLPAITFGFPMVSFVRPSNISGGQSTVEDKDGNSGRWTFFDLVNNIRSTGDGSRGRMRKLDSITKLAGNDNDP